MVAAATQAVAAWVGDPHAGAGAVFLVALAGLFLVADRLEAGGRASLATLFTSVTLLAAVPVLSVLEHAAAAVVLLAPVSFVLAVPLLRGRWLAAFGGVTVGVSVYAATADLAARLTTGDASVRAADLVSLGTEAGAASIMLLVLAWQMHRDAAAASARYAQLVGDLPVGISRTLPDGRFLEVNDAYVRIFGYPDRETLIAGNAVDLYARPEDRTSVLGTLDESGLVVRQLQGVRHDGGEIWVRICTRITRGPDGRPRWYDSAVEDVTRERQDREERVRFATVVDAAGIAVVTQTIEGTILGWNDAAARLYGWTPAQVGRTAYDVSPEDEWDGIRARMARVARGEQIGPFEIRREHGGRTYDLLTSMAPVRDADGAIVGIATVAEDVTAQRRLAEEHERLAQELEETLRLEATGRLAGGVAHEFNNLLTAIGGYGDLLATELAPGTAAREAADQIRRSSGQAADLVHQLLAFARRQVLRVEVVDVSEVVAEQVPLLRRVVGPGIALMVERASTPALVKADRTQLSEVVAHLVRNAREAMPDGGTMCLATKLARAGEGLTPAAELTAAGAEIDDPNEVVLSVSDTGGGIPDDVLPHVFEPFFTTKEVGRGTGLGLAMVHGLVRQSGGRTEIATGPAGTTVSIRLPLAAGHLAPLPSAVDGSPGDAATVLVVDDDTVVRTIVRRVLQRAGYTVLEAPDAGHARAFADAEDTSFDVVVSDVIMPGMRGPDLVRLLREGRPELPVVFVSGYTADEVAPDMLGERTRFLAKPFAPSDLLAAVEELVLLRP